MTNEFFHQMKKSDMTIFSLFTGTPEPHFFAQNQVRLTDFQLARTGYQFVSTDSQLTKMN